MGGKGKGVSGKAGQNAVKREKGKTKTGKSMFKVGKGGKGREEEWGKAGKNAMKRDIRGKNRGKA